MPYAISFLAAVTCHAAAWEIGQWIYPAHLGRTGSAGTPTGPLDHLFCAVFGLAALGLFAFALGTLHLLYRPLLDATTLAPAAFAVVRIARWRPNIRWRPSVDDIPLIVAVLFLLAMLPEALLPVLDHDDNVYHLFLPTTYLAHHGLFYVPSTYANMPSFVELLYMYPLSLADFTAPKVFALLCSGWTVLGLVAAARPRVGRFGAGVLALVFLSGCDVQWHLGRGNVEPVIGLFLLTAAVCVLEWWSRREPGLLWCLGVGLGAAAASKYQGWIYGAAIFAAFALAVLQSPLSARERLRAVLLPLVPFVALVLPWVIKNAVLTGNPIYPMLFGVFGGRDLSAIQVLHMTRSLSFPGSPKTFMNELLLPFRLAVSPGPFMVTTPDSLSLYVLLLGAACLPAAYRAPSRYLLAMAGLGFVGWALSSQIARFLVPWMPVMTLATLPLVALAARRRWTIVALATAVAVAAVWQSRWYPPDIPAGVPRMAILSIRRDVLVTRNINYELVDRLNHDPSVGAVLGMWDNRFYFLERPWVGDSLYEAPAGLARLRTLDDPSRYARELRADGVTHVVVNIAPMSAYFANRLAFNLIDRTIYPRDRLARDRELFDRFVAEDLQPLFRTEGDVVYRLTDIVR